MCYESHGPCRRPLSAAPDTVCEILAGFGRRILLIYGTAPGDSWQAGIRDRLSEDGFRLFEMSGAEPAPLPESVNIGASICRQERIDAILALGSDTALRFSKEIADAFRTSGSPGSPLSVVHVRAPEAV